MDPKQMRRRPQADEADIARPDRLEAIAMRRIVAEMGYWLSPMLKDHPIPVLSEWERTADLTALHNKLPSPTRMEVGVSVLDRLDEHQPRKSFKVEQNIHDRNANRKALHSWERLTDAERESLAKEKEQRRQESIAEKTARMKQTEAELRETLRAEDAETKEQREARQRKARETGVAKVKAQAEKAAAAKAISDKRAQTILEGKRLTEAERKRRKRAEAAALRPPKPPPMTEEQRKLRKREQERARKAKERGRKRSICSEPQPNRPPVDLSPPPGQLPAIEVARAMPLDELMATYLQRRVAIIRNACGRSNRPFDEAAARATAEKNLDKHLNQNAAFLYESKARDIEHNRANAIIDRELRRGSITLAEAKQMRLELSPFGERKKALAAMTVEERNADRLARKRANRAKAKENR